MDRLRDAVPRQRAEELGASLWVEAPAGSGKTSLLTARYLRLLGEVGHPAEILALTFTRRAAGEMRQRILEVLAAAARGEQGGDARQQHLLELGRLALHRQSQQLDLLASPESLQVMTFHAFCHLLVRSAPAEARVPLQASVLEDVDQRLLRREVVRRTLRALLQSGESTPRALRSALERRLLRLNNRLDLLEHELCDLLAQRDLFEDLVSALAGAEGPALTAALALRLRALIERRLARLQELLCAGPLPARLPELGRALRLLDQELAAGLPAQLPAAQWEALPAWQGLAAALPSRPGNPRERWGGRALRPELSGLLASLDDLQSRLLRELRELPLASAPLLEPAALQDLLRLGQGIIDIYEDALRRSGGLDFVELERAALRVLSEEAPSDLQLFLDARIRHLLVDEFQDTSRTQWTLVCRLCAGWQAGGDRTLFLVGDPKQSIYAFRKAEVSLFLQARQGIPLPGAGRLPLEPLSLATNFRSRPALVRWCNGFFEELLRAPDPECDEVGFSEGIPASDQADPEAPVRLALFDREQEEPRRREAAWLAALIARTLAEAPAAQPPSIAILPFTRTPMPYYLAACAAAGIRLQVKEGLLIRDTPEGAHLLNLCRALARPHDDLAWAALLRSPWSWQPMATLAGLPRATSFRERLRLAAAEQPAIRDLLEPIDEASRQLGRRPLADLCRQVWEAQGGPAGCARLRGLQAVENGRRLLAALEEAEQGAPLATLTRLEARLAFLYEPPDPAAADSPVWMMTVHGAKGLEFDTVFVPQLDRDPTARPPEAKSPPYLLERAGAEGALMAVQPDRRLAEDDALYSVLEGLGRRRLLGEAKRLLYVAFTRARRQLCLSGVVRQRERRGQRELGAAHRQSFLGWLLEHERVGLEADLASGRTPRHGLPVELDPAPPPLPAPPAPPAGLLPEAFSLTGEAAPYHLRQPSGAAEPGPLPEQAGAEEDQRARGVVVHALLERAAAGAPPPQAGAVEAALIGQGVAASDAALQAGPLLEEVQTCLAEPFLARLLGTPQPLRRSEWRLEAIAAPGQIWSGSVDLVVDDGSFCWVIDYKTTRALPAEPRAEFEERLCRRHRSQLLAYAEMIRGLLELPPERLRLGLYLTAEARWLEIPA